MIVKEKNQNYIMNKDLINSFEIDYIFDNKPIKRYKNKPTIENIISNLENLKSKIMNIIALCENDDFKIDQVIDGPLCHSGFERLN